MAEADPVELDGSEGEGGGQILRTALSLSLVTSRPFHIRNIRARRKEPGLRPQHLACVRGAEALGGRSEGAEVSASELSFHPVAVKGGDYLLEVGTAGSTPLLLQCLFYPLAIAGGGTLNLRGGTHVPMSPTYHYLARIWLPMLRRYGLSGELHLRYAGFYPQGAGQIRAQIHPAAPAAGDVELPARGTLNDVDVTSMVSNLPLEIAERQAGAAVSRLREHGILPTAENLPLPTQGATGTVVFIRAEFEHSVAGFTALGERGKPAEQVGREAADAVAAFMGAAGAIDAHLADQLLVPAALHSAGLLGPAGTTRFTTESITDHLTTNARMIERFLPVEIRVEPEGAPGAVEVRPRA